MHLSNISWHVHVCNYTEGTVKNIHRLYNNIMTWKRLKHYWPFVMGIHRSPVDSRHNGRVMYSFEAFFVISLNKLLNKQSSYRWHDMTWCSRGIIFNQFRTQWPFDGFALNMGYASTMPKFMRWVYCRKKCMCWRPVYILTTMMIAIL